MKNPIIIKISLWLKTRKLSDWLFMAILILLIFTRLPTFIDNHKLEGNRINPILIEGHPFPPQGKKAVIVFWALWCGPCTVELNRIKKAIEEKDFSPENIYAVNMGESKEIVDREIQKRKYNFAIVSDDKSELADSLKVKTTPTIAFINADGKLDWLSSGLSPSLIYRIRNFLKE